MATNITLKDELNEKSAEILGLQRRVVSVSKILKRVAKGIEAGTISDNFFNF